MSIVKMWITKNKKIILGILAAIFVVGLTPFHEARAIEIAQSYLTIVLSLLILTMLTPPALASAGAGFLLYE